MKHECPDPSLAEVHELARATGWTLHEVLDHPIDWVRDHVAYCNGVEKGFAEVRKAKSK